MEKDSWKWTLVNRTKLRGYFEKVQMLFRSLLFFVVLQDILNLVARYFETKTDQMQMLCLLWFVTSYNIYFTSKIRSILWFNTRKKNKLLEKTTNKKDWCCKSWKSLDGYETAGNLNWLVLNRIEVRLDSAETSAASSYYFLKFMLFLWLFKLQYLNSFPFITHGAGRHFVLLFCDFWNFNT